MTAGSSHKHYSLLEESINVTTHGLAFVLSLMALLTLTVQGYRDGSVLELISFAIFGASLVITYGTSTLYHSTSLPSRRSWLRIVDHASIYILIAGTYTPFTLITLQGVTGWILFGISWGMAVVGIGLKLFFTGKFEHVSTAMYVFMGWIIIFAFGPLMENLSASGIRWLVAGGVSYTVGALIYAIKKIPLNHAIFHAFTVAGSVCHFVAV
ncbi:MAG: hemolysin III family protein, partial [Pseudohongiellaceae bacterium]